MIINRKTAEKLIKDGRAVVEGALKPDDKGRVYAILTRYDLQRTDHYRID